MRFLVDAQLPPALARLLREHDHEAEHVTDIGSADAPDRDIWRYALARDAVIVTKDEDFADMVATGGEAPAIVWSASGTPYVLPCSHGSSHSSCRSSRWSTPVTN